MINFKASDTKIIIKGSHQGDYMPFFISIFLISAVLLLATQIIYGLRNYQLTVMITMFCILGVLKYLMWFSIKLTKDKVVIKKRFIGIPYVIITHRFQKVLYNEKVPILLFERDNAKIEVEIFDDFEDDGLLIGKNKKEYIVGKLEDAKIIFQYILDGLEKLSIERINSDIGGQIRD